MNILINLDRRIEGLFRRIATNTSAEDLSFYRVFVCLFFLITTKNLSFLSEIPNGLLRPNILSLSNLLDSWPNSFFFHLLFGIRILTCITSILGIRARMSLLILGMCIIIEHNFYNSFGKIDSYHLNRFDSFYTRFYKLWDTLCYFTRQREKNSRLCISYYGNIYSF